jgi:hypothetical protein
MSLLPCTIPITGAKIMVNVNPMLTFSCTQTFQ